jgi:hypothetical protein
MIFPLRSAFFCGASEISSVAFLLRLIAGLVVVCFFSLGAARVVVVAARPFCFGAAAGFARLGAGAFLVAAALRVAAAALVVVVVALDVLGALLTRFAGTGSAAAGALRLVAISSDGLCGGSVVSRWKIEWDWNGDFYAWVVGGGCGENVMVDARIA